MCVCVCVCVHIFYIYSLRDVERRPVLCSFKRIEGGSAYQKNSQEKSVSTSSTRPRPHCPASVCLALASIVAFLASLRVPGRAEDAFETWLRTKFEDQVRALPCV